jgi:hypothetical protein
LETLALTDESRFERYVFKILVLELQGSSRITRILSSRLVAHHFKASRGEDIVCNFVTDRVLLKIRRIFYCHQTASKTHKDVSLAECKKRSRLEDSSFPNSSVSSTVCEVTYRNRHVCYYRFILIDSIRHIDHY